MPQKAKYKMPKHYNNNWVSECESQHSFH